MTKNRVTKQVIHIVFHGVKHIRPKRTINKKSLIFRKAYAPSLFFVFKSIDESYSRIVHSIKCGVRIHILI